MKDEVEDDGFITVHATGMNDPADHTENPVEAAKRYMAALPEGVKVYYGVNDLMAEGYTLTFPEGWDPEASVEDRARYLEGDYRPPAPVPARLKPIICWWVGPVMALITGAVFVRKLLGKPIAEKTLDRWASWMIDHAVVMQIVPVKDLDADDRDERGDDRGVAPQVAAVAAAVL